MLNNRNERKERDEVTKQELDEIRRRAATQHPFDFFAYAKEDIPKLLDEVERLQKEIARMEIEFDRQMWPN
jgi:hypothetical protein